MTIYKLIYRSYWCG